jgi:UDP-N-acetylmuramoyl-tripeptide--D-alanyl-D-alanine ligase
MKITLEEIFNLPTAEIINPDNFKPVSSVSTDTRSIKKNSLFVALKGKNFDGHNYISDAVAKGASAVVVNKSSVSKLADVKVPVIAVKNTTTALGDLAKIWRSKFTGVVIGITGSNGKTTTKEILATLLSAKYKVQKTVANNNNNIGVPLTIFSAGVKHNALVLEMGTNHFGEIPYSANIAEPDYSLITNIGNSHLEFFKTKDGIYKEKSALFEATIKKGGKIFVDLDDKIIAKNTKKISDRITYGFNSAAQTIGKIKGKTDDGKTILEVSAKGKKFEVILPLYGKENAANYLAAASLALELGVNKNDIQNATAKLKAVAKRLDVKKYKTAMLIDDTYNANPLSMKSALDLLGDITKYERKIVILGDMFELGENAAELHAALLTSIKKNKITEVYTIGKLMQSLNEKLLKTKIINKHFTTRKNLISFIGKQDLKNSVILVKGSRGMKMEEFVQEAERQLVK